MSMYGWTIEAVREWLSELNESKKRIRQIETARLRELLALTSRQARTIERLHRRLELCHEHAGCCAERCHLDGECTVGGR